MPTKVGIKFCIFTRQCVSVDVTTHLKLCLHKQTKIVANIAYRVGSQKFLSYIDIASYLFPYFLL